MEGKTKKWMVHHFSIIWTFTYVNRILDTCNHFIQKIFWTQRQKIWTHGFKYLQWINGKKNSTSDRFPVRVSIQFLGGHRISEVPRHQMWTCLLVNINTKRTDYNESPTLLLYIGQQSYLINPWYQTSNWKAMDFSCWDLLSALCSYFRTTFCRTVNYVCLRVTLTFLHCQNVIMSLIKQSAYR